MSAEHIEAHGSRPAVPEGTDPAEAPVVITATVGDHTSLVFTTTPAAIAGPDGVGIEYLLDHTNDIVTQVLENLAEAIKAQQS